MIAKIKYSNEEESYYEMAFEDGSKVSCPTTHKHKYSDEVEEWLETNSIEAYKTQAELYTEAEKEALRVAKYEGENYTLNGIDYQVPFMKDDADGVTSVTLSFMKNAFTNTVLKFSNGTEMPITIDEFDAFGIWFAQKRNSFFIGE